MASIDLRTAGQKTRAERDLEICKAYTKLRKEQPLVTKNRVLVAVAKDFGLVTQTIKGILRKHDAYV